MVMVAAPAAARARRPAAARPRPPASRAAATSPISSAARARPRPASGATPAAQTTAAGRAARTRQQQRGAAQQRLAAAHLGQRKTAAKAGTVSLKAAGQGLEATQGRTGQHVLAAELLLFLGIVAVRAVAQYGPGSKDDLPEDQYGPLFILGNGLAVFFVLSFLAARGGLSARLAGVAGLIVDLALLLKSAAHITLVADQLGAPRQYAPEHLSGSYATGDSQVLSPALAYEQSTRQLPPQPKGASTAKYMAYARKSLSGYGLKVSQFGDLVKLWNAESGWRAKATNPNSGAYGIAQALPESKYPIAGREAGGSNGYDQIDWGLGYIKQTYGSIAAAWAHEVHNGWY